MHLSRKTRQFFLAAAIPLAAAVPLHAQQALPQSFGKWAIGGGCQGFKGKVVTPNTPVAREAKIKTAGSEFYCNGGKGVTAKLFDFNDPTGAYEFYTSELKVGMN